MKQCKNFRRSHGVKRVYRLFDCMTGDYLGRFYRSKNSALRAMYLVNDHGCSVILGRFMEFTTTCFRVPYRCFECFVKSR